MPTTASTNQQRIILMARNSLTESGKGSCFLAHFQGSDVWIRVFRGRTWSTRRNWRRKRRGGCVLACDKSKATLSARFSAHSSNRTKCTPFCTHFDNCQGKSERERAGLD